MERQIDLQKKRLVAAAWPLAPLALCFGFLPLLAQSHGIRPVFVIILLTAVTAAVVINIMAAVKPGQKAGQSHG